VLVIVIAIQKLRYRRVKLDKLPLFNLV